MQQRLEALFYWLNVHSWVRLILLVVTRRDVHGREHVPSKGPFILTSNHMSVGDPPIITGVIPRRIAWMAKQELFNVPVIGVLYRMFGCIPVRRFEGDLRALRRSQQALQQGKALGMFPEGTRGGARGLGPGEPGTALIALRTGAPILPVAIWGTENVKLPRDFFGRTHVKIRIGKPFTLPLSERITKEAVVAGTDTIMRRIAELLPEEFRGHYADANADRPEVLARNEG